MNFWKTVVILVSIMVCSACAAVHVHEETAPEFIGKVAICHKNKKTIYVDEAAVKAHLDHGDYLGVCQ